MRLADLHNRTTLFRRGDWIFATYGLFVAAAFLCQLAVGLGYSALLGRELLPIAYFYLLGFWPSVVVGGRVFSILLEWRQLFIRPLRTLLKPGYMLHGGVFGAMLAFAIWSSWSGRSLLAELDAVAFAAPLTESVCRLGCFVYGCCWGRPASGPWGVVYTSPDAKVVRCRPSLSGVRLHPAQLYSSGAYFVLFVAFCVLVRHQSAAGQVVGVYLVSHTIIRFVLEHFRSDDRGRLVGPVTHTHGYSLVLAVMGAGFLALGGEAVVVGPMGWQWITVFLDPVVAIGTLLSTVLVLAAFGLHYGSVGSWLTGRPSRRIAFRSSADGRL